MKHQGFSLALALLSILCALAVFISSTLTPFLSPLIIGILLGAALSPLYPRLNARYKLQSGISFGGKKLLRLGIILYGFYITLGELQALGLHGLMVACIIVVVVFSAALLLGKILKLDSEVAMLVGIGSAVCGAAAILALESTLKSSPSKSSLALGFIVLFGLLGMVGLPLVYYSGVLPLSDYQWGVYMGASLHEVANVVGAAAVSPETQSVALIVKMTRVVLLVPLLLVLSLVLYREARLESGVLESSADSPTDSLMAAPTATESALDSTLDSRALESVADSHSAPLQPPANSPSLATAPLAQATHNPTPSETPTTARNHAHHTTPTLTQKLKQNLTPTPAQNPKKQRNTLYIPYFALGFLAVIVLHSLIPLPPAVVEGAQLLSRILLTCAMVALGLQIDWRQFASFGAKTFALAALLFALLLTLAYALVYVLI